MPLESLIASLIFATEGQLGKINESLKSEKVIFPSSCKQNEVEIKPSFGGEKKGLNFRLSSYIKTTPSETTPALYYILSRARNMNFPSGSFHAMIELNWPEEIFALEKTLGDLTEINFCASFSTCDCEKPRIGFTAQSHRLEAEANGKVMKISATGDYRQLLPEIIDSIKPQFATIKLAADDAQRWIEKSKGFRKWALKRALLPRKNNNLYIDAGGGFSFGEKEEIEITVFTPVVYECEKMIKKPLIDTTNQHTQLVSLTKTFFIKNNVLLALQKIAQIVKDFKPNRIFDQPLLNAAQAKTLLEKEIELISQSYKNFFLFGLNTHMIRGPIIKRLAKETFGEDILESFDDTNASAYLSFLISKGFIYNDELAGQNDPEYIMKERYLLMFLLQSYATKPDNLIERYRQSFINKPPYIEISGKAKTDASKIPQLKLPQSSLITGISIREFGQGNNELIISRSRKDETRFWLRIPVGSNKLIDLQEIACAKMGITFK